MFSVEYCSQNAGNRISEALDFKIFRGSMPPYPPRTLAPSALGWRLRRHINIRFPVDASVTNSARSAPGHDLLSRKITCAATYALSNLGIFRVFTAIVWCRISDIFQNYLVDNVEETSMTSANFTITTMKIHEMFFYQCLSKRLHESI